MSAHFPVVPGGWLCATVVLLMAQPARLHAESAASLYNRAQGLDELRAIPLLLRAHALSPKDERITYRLGFLYQKMSRLTEAERFYGLTIGLKACHIRALNNLGGLRLDQRRDSEARELYMRAVRCKGSYYLPYYNLAGMHLEAGELSEAVSMYRAALSRRPKHPASHHNLGITYEKLARTSKERADELRELAVTHLRTACELEPKNVLNHFNYGRLLFNLNRLREAEVPLRRAVALAEGDSQLRGRALSMLAQIPPAPREGPK